jgi:hypothetical protein
MSQSPEMPQISSSNQPEEVLTADAMIRMLLDGEVTAVSDVVDEVAIKNAIEADPLLLKIYGEQDAA